MSASSEIKQTLYRLAWGTDRRDLAYITDAYTADVRWTRAISDDEAEVVEGRDDLMARLERSWARTPQPVSKHVISNVLIERETDEEAEVRSYKTVIRVVDGTPTVASSGWYHDVLVNEKGTWRIKERTMYTDGQI
jgi:3-phenylpropionate/cinnamic acid dioxygenase small subunit